MSTLPEIFLFLFRQERAGSSERSEKPDKRKRKEERERFPEVTSLPVAPSAGGARF
jgi:hypothetical protein